MNDITGNFDPAEQQKFDRIAASWWDPDGESRPLHDLNPARLAYITERVELKGARVVDVGCGGGILSESLAGQGAIVTGIDIAAKALAVARLHLHESGYQVDYRQVTAESWAQENPSSAAIVTCMEMLEHVPDPVSVVAACAGMLETGGHLFMSTLNRNAMSFAVANRANHRLPALKLVQSSRMARRFSKLLLVLLILTILAMAFVPWQQSAKGTGNGEGNQQCR